MGRPSLLAALVVAVASSTAHADTPPLVEPPACSCNRLMVVPSGDVPIPAAGVPRNAKLWVLGPLPMPATLEGGGTVRELSPHFDSRSRAEVFAPELAPGRYHLYGEVIDASFDVGDQIDTTAPTTPVIDDVVVDVAAAGTEPESLELLSIRGRFDADTVMVRATITPGVPDKHRMAGSVVTTPVSQLDVCGRGVSVVPGPAQVAIEAIDFAGNASPPVFVQVTIRPHYTHAPLCRDPSRVTCGLGGMAGFAILATPAVGGILSFLVTAAIRMFSRPADVETTPISLLAAEHIIRSTRAREAIVVAVVLAATPFAWSAVGPFAVVGPLWALIVAVEYLLANRALRLIETVGAYCALHGRRLVVCAGARTVMVGVSRRAIRRAGSVPVAKL